MTSRELARILGRKHRELDRQLEQLKNDGSVIDVHSDSETADSDASGRWLLGVSASSLAASVSERERRRLHRCIAIALRDAKPRQGDPTWIEIVRQFHAAGTSSKVVEYGMPLARPLKSTLQNRAAVDTLRLVAGAIPSGHTRRHVETALETAELEGRLGHLEAGIARLRETLTRFQGMARVWRTRVLLRLATLYSRRGDFRQADSLFTEGLQSDGDRESALDRAEYLLFLNEHAATKAFVGDYDSALALCERGLELAEAIGSLANRGVVLNNLGIVYNQSDRFEDAIRTFEEAECTCLQLDEGPSLTFVYGNLALLHAKTGRGDYERERAFEELEKLAAGVGPSRRAGQSAVGRREEFFVSHHRGLALLAVG